MNSTGQLIKNTTIYAIGDIIPKLFGFITFPILTKSLDPDEYGILNYINSIDVFIVAAGLLCLNTYYLVYYYKVGDEKEQRKLLGNLSTFIIVNYLLLSAIIFVFGPKLFKLIGSNVDFYPYIAIGIITAFFSILTTLPSALYRVRENPAPLTILNVIRGFVVMGFTIISVYLFKPSAVNVLWARFAATAIFGVIFFVITMQNADFIVNIPQLKHALKFSLPLVPATLATYLYSMFDKIFIDKYLTLSDLGVYSTAMTLAFMLNIVSYGAYKAFEPHFFKTYGSSGFDQSFAKVRNLLLFVVLIGGLFISGFSAEFLKVFTSEKYETANLYVPVLTLGAIASAMALMYSTIVTAREKTKISAAITIIGALSAIVMDVIFLRIGGIWAAAFISMFSYVFLCYGNMLFSHVKVEHLRPLMAVAIMALSTAIMTFFVSGHNLIINVLLKLLIILTSTLLLMKLLRVNIRDIINSVNTKS